MKVDLEKWVFKTQEIKSSMSLIFDLQKPVFKRQKINSFLKTNRVCRWASNTEFIPQSTRVLKSFIGNTLGFLISNRWNVFISSIFK